MKGASRDCWIRGDRPDEILESRTPGTGDKYRYTELSAPAPALRSLIALLASGRVPSGGSSRFQALAAFASAAWGTSLPRLVPLRMVSGLFHAAAAGVGRTGRALRNTVIPVVAWPGCFRIGAFGSAEGLAAAWLVAIPATCLLNFPRTSASFGVVFGDVVGTLVRPMFA